MCCHDFKMAEGKLARAAAVAAIVGTAVATLALGIQIYDHVGGRPPKPSTAVKSPEAITHVDQRPASPGESAFAQKTGVANRSPQPNTFERLKNFGSEPRPGSVWMWTGIAVAVLTVLGFAIGYLWGDGKRSLIVIFGLVSATYVLCLRTYWTQLIIDEGDVVGYAFSAFVCLVFFPVLCGIGTGSALHNWALQRRRRRL
jgi:hypothetical protein